MASRGPEKFEKNVLRNFPFYSTLAALQCIFGLLYPMALFLELVETENV